VSTVTTTLIDPALLHEVTVLVTKEARLLDSNELDQWLELLTDDVECFIPLGADVKPDRYEVSIIREDRFKTEARVWRAQQTGINHSEDPPSRIIRAVSNVEIEQVDGSEDVTVYFVTVMYESRPGRQRHSDPLWTFPIRCEYRLRRVGEGWKIACRQLNLLQRDGSLPPMTFVL
jgi:3-phenylpropionate/cinnamic acid dioxygenase small subunit